MKKINACVIKFLLIVLTVTLYSVGYSGTSCSEPGRTNPCGTNSRCFWNQVSNQAICTCVKGAAGAGGRNCTFNTPCTPNNGLGPCDPNTTTCTFGGNPPVANCICKSGLARFNATTCALAQSALIATTPAPMATTAAPIMAPPPAPIPGSCSGKNIGDTIPVDNKEAVIYQISPCKVAVYMDKIRDANGFMIHQAWGGQRPPGYDPSAPKPAPTLCEDDYYFTANDQNDGKSNTSKIVSALTGTTCQYVYAAQSCDAITSDRTWYMPAIEEVKSIAAALSTERLDSIKNDGNAAIMSSTEEASGSKYRSFTPWESDSSMGTYRKSETRFALFCSKQLN